MDSHNEQNLLQRAREGDSEAFRELVEFSQSELFQLAMELTGDWDDAEELSQQVFIKAYHGLSHFREEAKIMSWLYRIMVNTYIDTTRKERRRGWGSNKAETNDAHPEPFITEAHTDNPEAQTAARHIQDHISKALQALAPQQRSVFIMRHYHDLPLKEIARIMGLSVGTVKSQLFRAIRRLQKELHFYRAELGLEESL
jgi:RNA polymerase sigma-70 factor (ECF subfamily)